MTVGTRNKAKNLRLFSAKIGENIFLSGKKEQLVVRVKLRPR